MNQLILMQLKDEGFSVPINGREDPDGAARAAELQAEHVARNRGTVAAMLARPAAPAPAAKAKQRSAA